MPPWLNGPRPILPLGVGDGLKVMEPNY